MLYNKGVFYSWSPQVSLDLVLKNSTWNGFTWFLRTLHSCFSAISQHRCFWIWDQTWCIFFLPTCTPTFSQHITFDSLGTYQLTLAFLPIAEPHPWWSFHMCLHKLLHPHSRPVAPFHPYLGELWLREVGYCSGSKETEMKTKLLLVFFLF